MWGALPVRTVQTQAHVASDVGESALRGAHVMFVMQKNSYPYKPFCPFLPEWTNARVIAVEKGGGNALENAFRKAVIPVGRME